MALLASVVLTGCWGAPAIDRQGMVSILGLDLAPAGRFRATADIVNVAGLPPPTGAGQGSSSPVFVRSAVGSTPTEAIARLAVSSQTSLDLTHLQGVIASEAYARTSLETLANTFSHAELTGTAWLFVARASTAEALLRGTESVKPEPGRSLLQTALYGEHEVARLVDRVDSLQFRALMRGDDFATVGVGTDTTQGGGPRTAFRLQGLALFDGFHLTGWLDGPTLEGLLLDTNRLGRVRVTVPTSGGAMTFMVLSARRSIHVTATRPAPAAHIVASVVLEAQTAPTDRPIPPLTVAASRWRLRTEVAAALWQRGATAIAQAQAAGSDVLSLGQSVRVADPGYWRDHGATWETGAYRAIPVRLTVHVRIKPAQVVCPPKSRCGPSSNPAAA